ncbi:MAG: hypothetical protein Q8N03_11830 [Ignavibacteria bacterium]|jgi:bifunctional DNA-binding transcriptional regulator/antitoxin component of YhaV-PrlF toxin-antitoxin module|nr:hypothetical protein [Ignavibacteria bacterium]MDP3831195.1 hypothetical protein [Ignavibacteriaceae bacterium]
MKAFEFRIKTDNKGKICIPDEIIKLLPKNQSIRLLFLIDEEHDKKINSSVTEIRAQEYYYALKDNEPVYDDF